MYNVQCTMHIVPGSDWELCMYAPMHLAHYQRNLYTVHGVSPSQTHVLAPTLTTYMGGLYLCHMYVYRIMYEMKTQYYKYSKLVDIYIINASLEHTFQ